MLEHSKDWLGWLGFAAQISVLVLVSLHWSGGQQLSAVLHQVNAISVFLVTLQLLTYLKGTTYFGKFVSLLTKVVVDILPFFVIVLVVLGAF